jgi:ferredoxin--NADP+ reductase
LIGNVRYGTDIKLDDLQTLYDAVIFATGARKDRDLAIPGEDLAGSYGAADFVSWYDSHPDAPRDWPLTAQSVAVLGAGNVALDVGRVLAKQADDLLSTDISDNVYAGLRDSRVTHVQVFARRGPAQVKFSPMELRELAQVPRVSTQPGSAAQGEPPDPRCRILKSMSRRPGRSIRAYRSLVVVG